MKKRSPVFLRQDTVRHLRLGKKRRKLQRWRRPRGRHSKIRKKRFSYPLMPTVGYKSPRAVVGKVNGAIPKLVHNFRELDSCNNNHVIIIARTVGARKKLELIKKVQEKGLTIINRREQ